MTGIFKKKPISSRKSEVLTGYLFIAPIIILMAIWFYYPLLRSLVNSFYNINFLNPDKAKFVGFDNYIKLLKDSEFLSSMKISFILTFVSVPVQSFLALVIAVCLNRIGRGKTLYRTMYYLPYITSTIAVTTVFMYLFMEKEGLVTRFMTLFGMRDISWFADIKLALPFLIILCIWTYIGFYVVIYLTGLQSIPNELYESSVVDGASPIKQFLYITVPMLKPTTFLVITSGIIYAMQIFDQPFAVSRGTALGSPAGATSTMVIYFYNQAFRFNNAGYGSAAAFIIFIIIMGFTILQKRLLDNEKGL